MASPPGREPVAPLPLWLSRGLAAIRPLIPREFFGTIEINVAQGGITTVNLRQTYKERDDRVC
jgi:hypothetical protein